MKSPLPFQRARSSHQKEVRRQQLIAAAVALFDAEPWGEITVELVARQAGVAKGTTYRYFPTKESVFLEVLIEELDAWAGALTQTVGTNGRRQVASTIAATLAARPRLLRLLGLMHAVLESNVTPEAALAFRQHLLAVHTDIAVWAEGAAGVPRAEGLRFLVRATALVVGLGQLTGPSPAVAAALATDPQLEVMRLDFATELEDALAALL